MMGGVFRVFEVLDGCPFVGGLIYGLIEYFFFLIYAKYFLVILNFYHHNFFY